MSSVAAWVRSIDLEIKFCETVDRRAERRNRGAGNSMLHDPRDFRALLLGVSSHEFSVAAAIDGVATRLRLMIPDAKIDTRHDEGKCTRKRLLAAIDTWISGAEAHHHCLLYYFGHGGRVTFAGLGPELDDRVFAYLSCDREDNRFTGILDLELSTRIAALDQRCASVSTIIDACYSGTIVRASDDDTGDGEGRETVTRSSLLVVEKEKVPGWVEDLLRSPPDLVSESHPRVVRLAGASPRTEGHLAASAWQPQLRQGPSMGMFTAALLDTLASADDDWPRLSWDAFAHAIRERVIAAFRMGGQWIAQAGPRNYRIFSREQVELPRMIGVVETDYGWWIRAGVLAGVELGDRWAIADLLVDEHGRHRQLVHGKIVHVDLNRAKLALDAPIPRCRLAPASAFVVGLARPMPIRVDALVQLTLASPWLCGGDEHSRQHVSSDGDRLILDDRLDEWTSVRFPHDDRGCAELIELLEERARSIRLIEAIEHVSRTHEQTAPIHWELGVGDHELAPDFVVTPGDRIWVRLHNRKGGAEHWFASVILIDVIGRPWLLNASQPDGVELEPNDIEYVGRRPGAQRAGIELDWPTHANISRDGKMRLLLLVSGRPLQLGHLVRMYPDGELASFRMQGGDEIRRDPVHPAPVPALSDKWRSVSVGFQLRAPNTTST
jgi:hypothetical protein